MKETLVQPLFNWLQWQQPESLCVRKLKAHVLLSGSLRPSVVSAIQKMLSKCPRALLAEGREDADRGNFLRLPGTQTHCSRAFCYSKPLHSTAGHIGDSPWLHHVIFSPRHNYTMGFCLPWCQPVSKYMPLPRFASVEPWGCPLIMTQAYKCCIYLESRKPRVLRFREADGLSWRMVIFPCAGDQKEKEKIVQANTGPEWWQRCILLFCL